MADLPTGAVTFLFTDLEGSTRLLEAHPTAYRDAVARHHELLQGAVEAAGGGVFETVGDAVYAAFARPTDAVAAALAGQGALQREAWGATGPLRARMGLHTGEVEVQGAHYFGAPLFRCARLMGAAHGGQVVLSQATVDLVQDALPAGAGLRDLGEHRLKDLARPERVAQLLHPGLPTDFPALRSLDALPHNLPLQLTSFVGREGELAEVAALLGQARLLTLTGAGGCGKTRLALQAAADALDRFPDGVWLVELAPLADPDRVPAAVAAGLGLTLEPGRPPTAQLLEWLRPQRALVVLDNCEHVLDACAHLADAALRACPRVQVLATSREALGIAGERAWRVPSLGVPEADRAPAGSPGPATARPAQRPGRDAADPVDAAGRLLRSEAGRLFVDRAVAVAPDFALTPENAPAVAQICRRLDGVPLALELAAARVPVLAAEQIAARLDDAFRLLTGGSRTALPRQQTLRAAVDWSYALLSEPERAVLRRAAVFAGGFTLDAAEAVCAFDAAGGGRGRRRAAGAGAPRADARPPAAGAVLDLVGQLVAKSLVQRETRGGEARYRLLETLRLYGRERLVDAGEAAAARDRHLAWCQRLVEGGPHPPGDPARAGRAPAGTAPPGTPATGHEGPGFWRGGEDDNLRAALEWALGRDPQAGLRLAVGLGWGWALTHLLPDPGGRLDDLLVRVPERGALRAWGLFLAAIVHRMCGALDPARGHLQEARALFGQTGDRYGLARADDQEGLLAAGAGDPARARARLEASLVALRALDHPEAARVLRNLGLAALAQGDLARARQAFEESAALARARGAPAPLADARLGVVARLEGDLAGARARFEACLARFPDHIALASVAVNGLGDVARDAGDYAGARAYYDRLRARTGEVPDSLGGRWLLQLGILAVRRGAPERGARLLGATPAAAVTLLRMHYPDVAADREAAVAAARAALGEPAFAAAWAEGQAMSLEQAVADALADAQDDA